MRMLEAMQARMPMTAPMAPVRPAPKPSIEKMEKTKHAITKHLALLAAGGRWGLLEHICAREPPA